MIDYKGVIIEESLSDKKVLEKVKILSTKIDPVTKKHKTPWIKQWTMHTVEVPGSKAQEVATEISLALDSEHKWYADFENDNTHFIVFQNKVFKIDRTSKEQYDKAIRYGISLGIPDYQLDFSPHIKQWER
jgi:hypothetical protein